jgi:hypothetical protein
MPDDRTINRQHFLTFALATAGGALLGCTSSEPGSGRGGSGGGAAGSGGAGTGGSGGSASGSGGSASGTGGSASGTGGSASGTGGSAGGSGGAGSGGAAGADAGSGGAGGGSGGADGGKDVAADVVVAPNCGTKLNITITGNHKHVLKITMADITAAVTKVYNVQGTATHPHRIQVTAQDFKDLAAGKALRKASCDDGHEHEYLVNCVGAEGMGNSTAVGDLCNANRTCGNSDTGNFCPSTVPPPP